MKVLLVVDVQNDFCSGGSLAVSGADEIISSINHLMSSNEYDLVVASQDYHPTGHNSFASSHVGRKPFEVLDIGDSGQVLWPDHCVQGTLGAQFHPDLDVNAIQVVVQKGKNVQIDSYSAFFDNDRSSETELRTVLNARSHGQEVEIDICGLALDYCVAATAKDAARLGYRTRVLVDLTRSVSRDPKVLVELLRELIQCGVEIVEANKLRPGMNQQISKRLAEVQVQR